MLGRAAEWVQRKCHERRRRREQREFNELRDAATFFGDQVARIDTEIIARHAELAGLITTMNILAARRDALDSGAHQIEAMYRST